MYTQKSFQLKPKEASEKWWLVDAEDMVVGRLAARLATIIRGKNKAQFTPNTDAGDFVVVVNAEKVKFTGSKWDKKIYHRHSGFMGGIKGQTARQLKDRAPERIVYQAVKGMLPDGSLARKQLKKLRVFAGHNHDHEAQKPEKLEITKQG